MEYHLVSMTGYREFYDAVNKLIIEGYSPQGGVCHTIQSFDGKISHWYSQAMVKKV